MSAKKRSVPTSGAGEAALARQWIREAPGATQALDGIEWKVRRGRDVLERQAVAGLDEVPERPQHRIAEPMRRYDLVEPEPLGEEALEQRALLGGVVLCRIVDPGSGELFEIALRHAGNGSCREPVRATRRV